VGQQKVVAFDNKESFACGVQSMAHSANQLMASIVTTAELEHKLHQQSLQFETKIDMKLEEARLQQMAIWEKQQQQFEAIRNILESSGNSTKHIQTTESETISTLTPTLLAAPAHADGSGQLSL
jgi:hypothetical protein